MEAMLVPASRAIFLVVNRSMPYFSMQVTAASRISRRVAESLRMSPLLRCQPAHLSGELPQLSGGFEVQGIWAGRFRLAVLPVQIRRALEGGVCCQKDNALC